MHIIFLKARSWPPPVHYHNWFPFSFILPGEIISSHAAATQNKFSHKQKFNMDMLKRGEVCSKEHQKSTWMNRKPCLCAIECWGGVVGPSLGSQRTVSHPEAGESHAVSWPDSPKTHPSKPKFGDAVGIFFKKVSSNSPVWFSLIKFCSFQRTYDCQNFT